MAVMLATAADWFGTGPALAAPPKSLLYPGLEGGHPELVDVMPASGTTISTIFDSAAMGQQRGILLRLPRSYGMSQFSTHRYPVLYLLHGDFSDPGAWERLGASSLAESLAASGTFPEAIIVYANGIGQARLPEWEDNPFTSDQIESQVMETVQFVDTIFRTLPDRRFRAIGGLSSGAFGAVNIASRHPDVFGIAMSFSGYFYANGWVFRYIAPYIRANSPFLTVQGSPAARTVHYVLTSGLADPLSTYATRNFDAELRQLGVRVDTTWFPGAHTGDNWVSGLRFGLTSIGTEFQPPPPPPDPGPSPPLPPERLKEGQNSALVHAAHS